MRKMASIQRILALNPIPGADRIEVATVQGWQVVVKKGEYNVGDLVVYVEIDAWVPNSIAPFLTGEGKEPRVYEGVAGERLRTVKLRKQISQGLILPIPATPSDYSFWASVREAKEGDDVSDLLGIKKWEPAEEREANDGKGPQASRTRAFPYYLRKTDQERIQNRAGMIAQELDTEFEVTVKKDGSSCTIALISPVSEYYEDAVKQSRGNLGLFQRFVGWVKSLYQAKEPVIVLCSRNVMLTAEGTSNFHKAAAPVVAALKASEALKSSGHSIAIQGEVVAPDIQGNYEKVSGVEFHVFDIFDVDGQEYYTPEMRMRILREFGLKNATVVDKGTLRSIIQYKDGDDIVQKVLTYASGEGDNPGVMREGVVFKALDKDFSFKAVSNEYLLHKEKGMKE